MRLQRRPGSTSWRKALTWTVVAVVSALVAAEFVARHVVDADFVAGRLGQRLGPRFEVRIRNVGFSFLRGSLEVDGLRVRRVTADSEPGGVGPDVRVARLRMRGLDRLSMLRGRSLSMSGLTLDSVRVRIRTHALTRAESRAGSKVPPEERLGNALPALDVGRVRVTHADLVLAADDGSTADSVPGLSATLEELRTGPGRPAGGDRVLFSRDVRVDLPSYRHVTADGLHVLDMDSLALSTRDSTLGLGALRWHPTVGPSEFVGRIRHREDYVDLAVRGVRLRHADFGRLVSHHGFVAGYLGADSARLSVWDDKTVPAAGDSASPGMPTDWVAGAGVPLALDTGSVEDATVIYSETPPGGGPRGAVRFDRASARLLGLSNARARLLRQARAEDRGNGSGRTVLRMRAELLGKGRLRAELAADLDADSLDAHLTGGLGAMPASAVDSATTALAGIRVTGGEIDTIGFDLRFEGRRASGRVHALYRDLSLRKASPGEGSPDLLDRIGTVVINRRVWHANPDPAGHDPRAGEVDHTRAPGDTFFAYVWKSLRSGLLDAMKK
jgi:hypothetical protein